MINEKYLSRNVYKKKVIVMNLDTVAIEDGIFGFVH